MPTFHAERRFQRQGLSFIAGLDEAGRGAWAGPLVAAAVILPPPTPTLRRALAGVDDSKRLTAIMRETCARSIRAIAVAWGVGTVAVNELNAIGMTAATREAMARALASLGTPPQALLLDAFPLPSALVPQRAIIRGDSYSFSIAAASILAKVTRDNMMRDLDTHYPFYGFAAHKGYGTTAHREALQRHGVTPIHRRSFAPIRSLLEAGVRPPV